MLESTKIYSRVQMQPEYAYTIYSMKQRNGLLGTRVFLSEHLSLCWVTPN